MNPMIGNPEAILRSFLDVTQVIATTTLLFEVATPRGTEPLFWIIMAVRLLTVLVKVVELASPVRRPITACLACTHSAPERKHRRSGPGTRRRRWSRRLYDLMRNRGRR
jgi:hypothetical protein